MESLSQVGPAKGLFASETAGYRLICLTVVGRTVIKAVLLVKTCPACGGKRIRLVRRNWRDTFKGKPYTVPGLEFYECPDCGERLYDREAMRKIETHSPAYAKANARKKSA